MKKAKYLYCFLVVFISFKSMKCSLYQYFKECTSIPLNFNVNVTLNGKVKGQCINVPVSYSNGSTISNNVFRWLSIPYAQPPINQNRFKNPMPMAP